ncbi:MAG: hypothetical protein HOD92_11330 [Deltaproteobacteria bacterium]|jgi:hypothetical protein|nr:hypothetical protein [Deltaproteobacteria bacterium]MBT4526710.1 hypothetical protein [Deltaproteobacteria bacterium]
MENDLIGPKTLAFLYEELELNTEMDFTCLMASTFIDTTVFQYDEEKTIELPLPEGVRLIQLGVGEKGEDGYPEYMNAVVNFEDMNIKE